MKSQMLTCASCGASIKIRSDKNTYVCDYCGSEVQMPQEMFEDMNASQEILDAIEYNKEQKQSDTEGLAAWKKDRMFWNITLVIYVLAVAGGLWYNEVVSSELSAGLWVSFFIFGIPYVIASKPKQILYIGIRNSENRAKFFAWSKVWRILFFIWWIATSIMWVQPMTAGGSDGTVGFGMILLLPGSFLLTFFRPGKLRRQEMKRIVKRRRR